MQIIIKLDHPNQFINSFFSYFTCNSIIFRKIAFILELLERPMVSFPVHVFLNHPYLTQFFFFIFNFVNKYIIRQKKCSDCKLIMKQWIGRPYVLRMTCNTLCITMTGLMYYVKYIRPILSETCTPTISRSRFYLRLSSNWFSKFFPKHKDKNSRSVPSRNPPKIGFNISTGYWIINTKMWMGWLYVNFQLNLIRWTMNIWNTRIKINLINSLNIMSINL